MTTYQFYAYSASALVHDAASNSYMLKAGYDPATDRILVTITDNDSYFNGDHALPELGDDTNQMAVVTRPDGTVIASGRIYDEAFSTLSRPGGGRVRLDEIEIAGVRLGYFAAEPLVPGQPYPVTRSTEVTANNHLAYSQINSIPCFAPGTMIATDRGEIPVERLIADDRIMTLDHSYQPLLWSGCFTIPRDAPDNLAEEVTFAVGSLGPDLPRRPLSVTGCHRMLLSGAGLALHFGESEAFAAADHMAPAFGIMSRAVTAGRRFYHLLLPDHEVILANGVWTESLFADSAGAGAQPPDLRYHLQNLAADGHRQTARLCLRRWEVDLIQRGTRRVEGQRAAA